MNAVPSRIGLGIVVCYIVLDDRPSPTDATSPKGLAICQYPNEDGVYLVSCDENWKPISDSWFADVLDALHQAELQYQGRLAMWIEAAN